MCFKSTDRALLPEDLCLGSFATLTESFTQPTSFFCRRKVPPPPPHPEVVLAILILSDATTEGKKKALEDQLMERLMDTEMERRIRK